MLRQDQKDHAPLTVAILGGNPVVGRTLEVMLQSAGYDARFLNGTFVDRPAELPEEVGLVILTPGLHPKGRKRFVDARQEKPAGTPKVPVLELVNASERERASRLGCALWPCRAKDLEREIEAIRLAESRVG